jgi:glucose-6-phosphate isomerase
MAVKLSDKYLHGFVNMEEKAGELAAILPMAQAALDSLHNKTGMGSEFLGWTNLPERYFSEQADTTETPKQELIRVKQAAAQITADSEVLIVIGIGGSYLGARAVIEALRSTLYNSLKKTTPEIYFVGNSLNPAYLSEVVSLVKDRDFSVNVISKSGTTTEPALAFRVFRKLLTDRYGDKANERIYATTDAKKGTLHDLAAANGWTSFVVPDDVGGRYSVLTAVGLLPIAVAGIDVDMLLAGAFAAQKDTADPDIYKNDCLKYAAYRNILARKGYACEMLVSYDNSFAMMNEWFKQLFGESEGKDGKGVFPVSALFSTDLHSLGQFIQEGSKILFETVVQVAKPRADFFLDLDESNADGLNFLANQNMSVVNQKAFEGTIIAHTQGGVPNIVLELPELNEHELGYLIYFFEKACAISGYMLGVNPFDQPGVESYKKNMFALLGKPGYEDRKAQLEALISE